MGEGLDCRHEDWRRGRRIGLWTWGLEDWEKDWTLDMRTGGVGERLDVGIGTGGVGEGLDCRHEDWRGGRKIGL